MTFPWSQLSMELVVWVAGGPSPGRLSLSRDPGAGGAWRSLKSAADQTPPFRMPGVAFAGLALY